MKIAYTGSHGTGKTVQVLNRVKQLKLENPHQQIGLLMEIARECPGALNLEADISSQIWIFCEQCRREIALIKPFGRYDLLVTDRSIMDCVAYAYYLDLPCWPAMFSLASIHLETYDQIVFLTIANNNHWHADGIRDATDAMFRQQIETILISLYIKAQAKVIYV